MSSLESRGRRSVPVKNLIAELEGGKPPPRRVVVCLIPGVEYDANATAEAQPVLLAHRLRAPRLVVDADPVGRNRRRDGVLELHQVEEERIVLLAGPPHVQVHVVEPVHRPDLSPAAKSRPRFTRRRSASARRRWRETRQGSSRGRGAAGADVDIGEIADAQPLVERTDAVVRDRIRHDAVADGADVRVLSMRMSTPRWNRSSRVRAPRRSCPPPRASATAPPATAVAPSRRRSHRTAGERLATWVAGAAAATWPATSRTSALPASATTSCRGEAAHARGRRNCARSSPSRNPTPAPELRLVPSGRMATMRPPSSAT